MTATTPLNATRVADIANAIRGACSPIVDADLSSKEAKDLVADLREQGLGVREHIMTVVAKLSLDGAWDAREVVAGAKAAAKSGNDLTDKSMATFIGQVKLAAMPLVRDQFTHLYEVVSKAWDEEKAQLDLDKASPCPIKTAWKRKFHTLVHVCKVVSEGERTFPDVNSLVNYATDCDPAHDAEKIRGRIETIVKQIVAMHGDFPSDDLKLAADYLDAIEVKTLQAARAQKLATFGGEAPLAPAATSLPEKSQTGVQRKRSALAPASVPVAPVMDDAGIADLLGDNVTTLEVNVGAKQAA